MSAGVSSINKFRSLRLSLPVINLLKSFFDKLPVRIFSDERPAISETILVASCSEDISNEKKITFFSFFLSFKSFVIL